MRNGHLYIAAAVLTLAGLAIFAYKTLVTGFPVYPGQPAQAWEIETQIEFVADGGPAKVITFIPGDSHGQRVFDHHIVAPGFGASIETAGANKVVVLATRAASGPQIAHINFIVHRFSSFEAPVVQTNVRPAQVELEGAKLAAAKALAEAAHRNSADELTLVTALLQRLNGQNSASGAPGLGRSRMTAAEKVDLAVQVLALQDMAARRVNGIDLAGVRDRSAVIRWLEVFVDDKWVEFSPATGEPRIPKTYLAWWRGRQPLITVEGGSRPVRKLSFVQRSETVLDRVLKDENETSKQVVRLSLFGLPLAVQDVYRILMVVPLGIFILVIIRNVIGLKSLGTFMPVLIALAFRETKLIWGIMLFVTVVGSGLLFRAYLENLKLLLVPRLASVLIFVVLFMAAMSVVTNQLGFQRGLSVALFPMVIMTMTIERVSVIWDELGPQAALRQAIGSLVISTICYLVMFNGLVEHLFFTFPELLLILLAWTMLLGRYSGYRLLELPRFRVLAGGGD